ncbi:fluoride efflux transporter CrcB [Sediminispirochaeta bajacaliforniensis]|uniref:fluoride efflux transporter CrcB n=1 Tax=Sediminispirochaeta bajacaliforniensis TaxID=148 RepID=UPI00047830FE|nr:fluoride efflux transporter CrcB [Sediminispirochaeta bajacaliforniensis]
MWVLMGGGLGAASRYLISLTAGRLFGDTFAWGTMTVNLVGCFFIGFIVGLADRTMLPRVLKVVLVTGFLGGFTTFSSFSLESVRMFLAGSFGRGMANLAVNVVVGLVLTLAGLVTASRI